MKYSSSTILFAIVLGILTSEVFSHSYVTNPITRGNQKQTTNGCRGPDCLGPCEVKKANAKTAAVTIARGAKINVEWPRNNHAGGFIRIAWAQTSLSDSHTEFDNNVQEYSCHERGGCKPDDAGNPNGGDSGPADGSGLVCQLSVTVPSHLTDGTWTMQWAWFGGAFALGDYYSCVDYKIQGGVAVTTKQSAFFVGGDYTYPNQDKCKFFNTDKLHQCVNEPCNNPVYTLNKERSGKPDGISTTTPTTPPPTTPTTPPPTTPTTPPPTTPTTPPPTTPTTPPTTVEGMCYKKNTPFLGGIIKKTSPQICGVKNGKNYRCAEGQCCSKYGYCGPIRETDGNFYDYSSGMGVVITEAQAINLYCNENTIGDYRKSSCSSLGITQEEKQTQIQQEQSSTIEGEDNHTDGNTDGSTGSADGSEDGGEDAAIVDGTASSGNFIKYSIGLVSLLISMLI